MAASFTIGWRQVAACGVLLSVSAMLAPVYSVIAAPLGQEFHPPRAVLMLAMTIMSGVGGLLSPLLGNQMDRVSLRRLMFLGVGLLVLGIAAISFATSFTQVLVIYGLLIAPANILIGPMAASVLISRWFVRRRGAALGIAISGVAVGGFLFPPLLQGLLDLFAWREAFRVFAVILLVLTLPAAAAVIERPSDRGLHPDGEDGEPEVVRAEASGPLLSVSEILSDPSFWCIAILWGVVLSGVKGMVTNLVPLALDQGINANAAALLVSIYAGCGFISKLSFAVLADRFGLKTIMFVGVGGFAIGMACLAKAQLGYGMIALGVGIVGLFSAILVPMQGLIVPRLFGQRVIGRAMGVMNFFMLLALLTTPPLFGLVYDRTGSYDAIFIGFAILGALLLLIIPRIRLGLRNASAAPIRPEQVQEA